MNNEPAIKDDPMYRLIRDGQIEVFNKEKRAGKKYDLTGCDFRGISLRGLDTEGLDLRNCYLRQADLRGLDLRSANLEGASIHGARISGVYFPGPLRPEEIELSLLHGTRLRYLGGSA
jgi:uncharacterized protein YjbI with pentapeptide repeats